MAGAALAAVAGAAVAAVAVVAAVVTADYYDNKSPKLRLRFGIELSLGVAEAIYINRFCEKFIVD